MNTTHIFPSTYLTSDIVVFDITDPASVEILLIQRKNEPFKDCWALPGGFFDPDDQNITVCAQRELAEETSLQLDLDAFKFIGLYSEKNRDPRENNKDNPCRIASAAFTVNIKKSMHHLKAKDDAKKINFFKLDQLPKLAFDHSLIIRDAVKVGA